MNLDVRRQKEGKGAVIKEISHTADKFLNSSDKKGNCKLRHKCGNYEFDYKAQLSA